MLRNKILISIISLCFSHLLFSSDIKENKPYQIEFILFQHTPLPSKVHSVKMIEPQYYGHLQPLKTITLEPGEGIQPYTQLPKDKLTLQREEIALKAQPHYQLITHLAWQQSANDEKKIRLNKVDIDGMISIKKRHYYDLKLSLQLATDCNNIGLLGPKKCYYRLTADRKLSPNKLYYLDGKALGMILKVKPVEIT